MSSIVKKKKIVFVIPSFRVGGVDRVVCNIINSLDRDYFDITLIVCMGDESYNRLLVLLKSHVKTIILNKNNFRSALPYIIKVLKDIKPNIVFTSHNHVGLAILLCRSLCFKSFKVITRISTLPSNNISYVFREKVYNKFFSFFVKKADVVIAQSVEMKEEIQRYYNVRSERVLAIKNLVDKDYIFEKAVEDCNDVIKSNGKFTFVSVGILSEVKGFDVLIESVKTIIDKGYDNLCFYIIGENLNDSYDCKSDLEKKVLELKLEKYIHFIGFKENPYYYLNQADAFVLSSRKEGFPNVVLEALTLGKPCLVTNCVNFEGIIDNTNGIIVEKDNVRALAQGIIDIQKLDVQQSVELVNFDYTKWLLTI
ncbi:glycosyltransferase [Myroides marinus]|uniref:glycosyltransferase n=1 Tax=Myroides marinus TaxID=703342 RepID=UPI002576D777|nr:glycosyltransferase [Myroides marinus]MDM1391399.1 glycosyltransferase [Myroides marinus]